MHRLLCNVQKYGWGRRGHESKCALFKKAQDPVNFNIVDTDTYAELWMGTHTNCPSKIELQNQELTLLSDYIKSNPSKSLGDQISQHFYTNDSILNKGDLPFLFKVLSINQALSIQAHPNKSLARELNKKDPKNYPDSNHKPEMLIAISEQFDAMCGFRPSNEISENFKSYPELVELCSKENCDQFNMAPNEESLRKCFNCMMTKKDEFINEQFLRLKNRLSNETNPKDLDKLFLNLAKQYPNDVGCFSIYLLNCLKLKKGEAIFLSANVPHAYLYGDGVECMACSDNVVRAGLTPKFKDVQVLCDMLDYSMRSSEENKLGSTKTCHDYLIDFKPSVDEFSVQQIRIETKHLNEKSNSRLVIPAMNSGSILIVCESNSGDLSFESNGAKFESKPGLVYFIDSNTDVYLNIDKQTISNDSDCVLLAFRAYCDIKS